VYAFAFAVLPFKKKKRKIDIPFPRNAVQRPAYVVFLTTTLFAALRYPSRVNYRIHAISPSYIIVKWSGHTTLLKFPT